MSQQRIVLLFLFDNVYVVQITQAGSALMSFRLKDLRICFSWCSFDRVASFCVFFSSIVFFYLHCPRLSTAALLRVLCMKWLIRSLVTSWMIYLWVKFHQNQVSRFRREKVKDKLSIFYVSIDFISYSSNSIISQRVYYCLLRCN